MNELKPCPFCGNEVTVKMHRILEDYNILCSRCGLAFFSKHSNDKESIITGWNTRTTGWIPVNEENFPLFEEFIATDGQNVEQCYMSTSGVSISRKMLNWNEIYNDKEIIAWQPLPEPYRL